jgi:DNA-binding response OmpR family regulator
VEWSHPSSQQIITYTNIPNGNFRLKVRMYNNSLSQIVDERTLDIHVIPLYWQTWWFRLVIFIIIMSTTFFVLKFYINRLKQRHAEDKIRFFTNTAHDLRTSITLINAPIQELNKEEELSEKGHYYLNLAMEQSERLSNVATQLLDFQKVDMGKGQLFLVMVDIVNLVYRRKTMFKSTAGKKNVILEFVSNKESYMSAVDELKIEKVVDNLISNAIKYSHTNGKEVVEVAPVGHEELGNIISADGPSDQSEYKQEDDRSGKKKSILIVDDNKDLRNFLKCSFENQYYILEAGNGNEAWELLQKESPELTISDVMMPDMDGFELCKLIKSTFETSHIPVILLTSLCDKSDQLEGLGLGAEDYITKPFDISLLEQRIKSLMRNREKAVEVIHNNMQNLDFDKESFAMEMHVSGSLLYKKIKALTGQSPIEFIKSIRLNRALELLQSHKYTITEVSELCGYSSISYFSTVFKKYFGKSPTEV